MNPAVPCSHEKCVQIQVNVPMGDNVDTVGIHVHASCDDDIADLIQAAVEVVTGEIQLRGQILDVGFEFAQPEIKFEKKTFETNVTDPRLWPTTVNNETNLPQAWHSCNCVCHRSLGVSHGVPSTGFKPSRCLRTGVLL